MAEQALETILFVDDEPQILEAIRRMFHREGINVVTATNAKHAMELMPKYYPKVVLSDNKMPGMSGVEFLAWVKKNYPATVRILLTGFADLEAAEAAINKGEVFRFIEKPWEDNELKRIVWQGISFYNLVLENQRLQRLSQEQNRKLKKLNEELEAIVKERTEKLEEAISELRQKNHSIQKMQIELVQSEKLASLGLIAAGVIHELNNPLGAILAYSQLLKEEFAKEPEVYADLKEIENAVFRCKKILEDLKSFVRQGPSTQKERISLNRVVESVLNLVQRQFELSNVVIEKDLSTELREIEGNFHKLQSALINLLINAKQAMPNGGKIVITTRGRENEQELSVKDTGEGVPEEHRGKIFEPFFTTKKETNGTGLGLAIVKRVVEEHNGRIELESEPGKGSIFRLFFPLNPPSAI